LIEISHHVEQSGEARRECFSGEIFIPSFVLHDERGGVGKSGILVFEQLVEFCIEIVFQSNYKNASWGFLDIIIIIASII
jgi:hypothetical protein